jgi:hypothetical protein
LCGNLISNGAAEVVMVGECWHSAVIFCMVRACKKMSPVRTLLKLVPELVPWELSGNLLMMTLGTSDYMFTTKLQPPESSVTTMLQPPESSVTTMLQPPESSVRTMLHPPQSSVTTMLQPPESSVTTWWRPFVVRWRSNWQLRQPNWRQVTTQISLSWLKWRLWPRFFC